MNQTNTALTVAQMLASYGIRASRQLGQHFLIDKRHLVKLIRINELAGVDTILEVGPGPGNLTELLLETSAHVLAVEIDDRFVRLLNDRFAGMANFELIHADILRRGKLNPTVTSVLESTWRKPWAVVANLPYQVATTVILELLYLDHRPEVICVTVQKEVARRLKASPGSKDFSALSVLAQSYTIVKLLAYVPAGSFWPRPNVDSAIVTLAARKTPNIRDGGHLRNMVNAMFKHRRKMLRTGFLRALPKSQQVLVETALTESGIDLAARAQQLGVDQFVALSNRLVQLGCTIAARQ